MVGAPSGNPISEYFRELSVLVARIGGLQRASLPNVGVVLETTRNSVAGHYTELMPAL